MTSVIVVIGAGSIGQAITRQERARLALRNVPHAVMAAQQT